MFNHTKYGKARSVKISEWTDPVVSKTLDPDGKAYIETKCTVTAYITQDTRDHVIDKEAEEKQLILARNLADEAAKKQAIVDKLEATKL